MNKKGFLGKLMIIGFLLVVALSFYLLAKINPNTEIIKTSPPETEKSSKISSDSTLNDLTSNNKTNSTNTTSSNYKIVEDTP